MEFPLYLWDPFVGFAAARFLQKKTKTPSSRETVDKVRDRNTGKSRAGAEDKFYWTVT